MGADAYSYLTLGFKFSEKDLKTSELTEVQCSKGHCPTGGQKFCAECGGKFSRQTQFVYTDGFKAWADNEGVERDDEALAEFLDYLYSEDGNTSVTIHEVGEVLSSYDRGNQQVIGIRVMETGRHRQTDCHPDFSKEVEKLKRVAGFLGIKDPDVKLYLSTYWSV